MPSTKVPGIDFIIVGKIVIADEWSATQLFIIRAQVMHRVDTLKKAGHSQNKIAELIEAHRSTIPRELKSNAGCWPHLRRF